MSSKWRMAVATLVLLASPRHSAAQDVDLLVTSGSGGVAKAERSTPVRITIEAPQAPVAGDLVVEWGDARLVRAVHLASPAQHQFEVYPRTSEPEALVRVRFVPERGNARGVDLPLEVIASDREITLCVRSEGGSLPEAACTVTTDAALLPRSLRGYEAIDEVRWAGGDAGLSAEQRTALVRWAQLRQLEQSGDLGLTPQPTRPQLRRGLPATTTRSIFALVFVCLCSLLAVGLGGARRRVRLAWHYLGAGAVAAGATIAAHGIGRIGPGSAAIVHQATVMHQLPDTSVSLVSIRGVLESPAFDPLALVFPLSDGYAERTAAGRRAEQQVNDAGFPMIRATYAMGGRQAFSAEGFVTSQPLAVAREGDRVTVSNQSGATLHDCRFGDGFTTSDTQTRSLPSGAELSGRQLNTGLGPLLTCTADAALVTPDSPTHEVMAVGATLIAVYDSRPQIERTRDD